MSQEAPPLPGPRQPGRRRQHQEPGPLGSRVRAARRAMAPEVARWRATPPAGRAGTWSGGVWALGLGVAFFYMANPLIYEPSFQYAFERAIQVTVVTVVLTLPRLRLPTLPWSIGLFLGFAALSLTWSVAPAVSEVAVVLYLQMAFIGLVAGSNVDVQVASWGLALGGLFTLGASEYAFAQETPGAIFHGFDGPVLLGVGTNQNILAYTLAIALAGACGIVPRGRWTRVLQLLAVGVLTYGLFRAGSATGLLTGGCVLAVAGLAVVASRMSLTRRVQGAVGALFALALVGGGILVDVVLEKDFTSFSGRLPLWEAVLAVSGDAPVLGVGWGAVWGHPWWPAPPNDTAAAIYEEAGAVLSHGHNNFFDVLPELGAVGVLLVVAVLAHLVLRSVRSTTQDARLLLPLLVAVLVFGISEPLFTIPLGWWVLTVALSSRPRPVAVEQRVGTP